MKLYFYTIFSGHREPDMIKKGSFEKQKIEGWWPEFHGNRMWNWEAQIKHTNLSQQ